ncbi:MAG: primosomal protein N', partial [Micrococcus sp.]|nr:primosomal protein N' [Micrococcus sp.]
LVEAARRERRPGTGQGDDAAPPLPPLPWIGPVPDAADETRHRALLLFPYAAAAETAAVLRAARAAASARREQAPVRLRLDPPGVL